MSDTLDDTQPLSPSELLTEIVMALVDHPDQVRVEEINETPRITLWWIHVHPDDRGKVIGKGGATISSMRHLLSCIMAPRQQRAEVEVANSRQARQARRAA